MQKPTGRTCHECGKTLGVTFYAIQTLDGSMRSTPLHPGCANKLRQRIERERATRKALAQRLFSSFSDDKKGGR